MIVRVTTSSRLHFGLFSFGRSEGRQYGGVGAMLERPGLRLTIERDEQTSAQGPLAERAVDFANIVAESLRSISPHRYRITIESAPPEHVGLGTGTQLGMAISAGALRLSGIQFPPASEFARLPRRGQRSAIGTYGFLGGGLLLEGGKEPGKSLSPLLKRVELPDAWRFVLLRPTNAVGLSGVEEQRAFAAMPPVPESVSQQLQSLAEQRLLPAATFGDFEVFSHSLGRYSRLAGECFAARQGGPYSGPQAARLVNLLKSLGAEGVGQSSWGPTLFAVQPDQAAAETLTAKLQTLADEPLEIIISPPANRGASVETDG